jgi:hypothetical protein
VYHLFVLHEGAWDLVLSDASLEFILYTLEIREAWGDCCEWLGW